MTNYVTQSSDKSKDRAFILCLCGGIIGLHYYYVGRYGRGLLYSCTMGLIGIGWLSDLVTILLGNFRDNVGAPLRAKGGGRK